MVVWAPAPDGSFRDVAERIADDRDQRLVHELPAEDVSEEVMLVGHPSELDVRDVLSLQRRLDRKGPDEGGYGIVTGLTASDAWATYRPKPTPDEHVVVVRNMDNAVDVPDTETTVLVDDDATADALANLGTVGSLSMVLGGETFHATLEDGYLCGFPTDRDVMELGDPDIHCVNDGERDCPLDGELVPTERIQATHVLLNYCRSMSLGTEGQYHPYPIHAGLNLLPNAAAVIGAYRNKAGRIDEVLFHDALVQAGYTASERCYLLSKATTETDLTPYPYALFGRPEAGIEPSSPPAYDVEFDGQTLTFHDVDARVLDVSIDDPYPDADRYFLRNVTDDSPRPLFYAAFETGGSVRLLVYGLERFRTDRIDLELDRRPYRAAEYDRLKRTLDNAAGLDRLGVLDGKAQGQLENASNQLPRISPVRVRERYDTNAYRQAGDRIDSASDALEPLRDRIVHVLENRSLSFFSNEYLDRVAGDGGWVHDSCLYCPNPVFVKRLSGYHDDSRLRGMCPRCVNVFDVPDAEPLSIPQLSGSGSVGGEEPLTVELAFENPTDAPVEAVFFPLVHSVDEAFDPDRSIRRLDPHERATERFEVTIPDLHDGPYPVYGYVVVDADVYLSVQSLYELVDLR